MRSAPRGGVTAGVVAVAGALSACVGDAYQPWFDQNKGAVLDPGGAGGTQGADGGHAPDAGGTPDAGTSHDAAPGADGGSKGGEGGVGMPPAPTHTVFYVLMAHTAWADIVGSPSAPYINKTLLPLGAHGVRTYAAPDQVGNSLPNVVWLEAGQDFGFTKNASPGAAHVATTSHLVNQLEAAGLGWKAYVEGATAGACPISDQYPYRTWHVPFLYFDDVVGNPPSAGASRCVQHVVPFAQLAADLAANKAPAYAFLVPDLCDDMHDDCNTGDPIKQGDDWLAANVPPLLASHAYASGGFVFVAWDYDPAGYAPIGFIALSPKARAGYASHATHTTSSTLRSLQTIFGVAPLLGDAANANDVSEMFTSFP